MTETINYLVIKGNDRYVGKSDSMIKSLHEVIFLTDVVHLADAPLHESEEYKKYLKILITKKIPGI